MLKFDIRYHWMVTHFKYVVSEWVIKFYCKYDFERSLSVCSGVVNFGWVCTVPAAGRDIQTALALRVACVRSLSYCYAPLLRPSCLCHVVDMDVWTGTPPSPEMVVWRAWWGWLICTSGLARLTENNAMVYRPYCEADLHSTHYCNLVYFVCL
jgi:hypothetical protein